MREDKFKSRKIRGQREANIRDNNEGIVGEENLEDNQSQNTIERKEYDQVNYQGNQIPNTYAGGLNYSRGNARNNQRDMGQNYQGNYQGPRNPQMVQPNLNNYDQYNHNYQHEYEFDYGDHHDHHDHDREHNYSNHPYAWGNVNDCYYDGNVYGGPPSRNFGRGFRQGLGRRVPPIYGQGMGQGLGYNQEPSYGRGYNPRYGMNYGAHYNTGYGMGYGQGYNPGYGIGDGQGYGSGYNMNYGAHYNTGYGMGYGPGYDPGYGMGYGPGMGYIPGFLGRPLGFLRNWWNYSVPNFFGSPRVNNFFRGVGIATVGLLVAPSIARALRPLAVQTVEGVMNVTEEVKGIFSDAKEDIEDIFAEANWDGNDLKEGNHKEE